MAGWPRGGRGPRRGKAAKPDADNEDERRQQRCVELAADGQYAKAAKALVSPAPLGRTEETEKAMVDKHPRAQGAPDLSDLAAPGRAQVPEFDAALVRKMLKSFSRGTAPGLTGLRAQHLVDTVRSAH